MVTIHAVIGAGFGDEGKGLMTDFFATKLLNSTCVVRFNGGSQAGHTVTKLSRGTHVFHHFGSGSLANCDTYLSKHFIVNPFLWHKELLELKKLNAKTTLKINEGAILSTPYDMLLNSRLSKAGTTCGVGINETIQRCEKYPESKITANDIGNFQLLRYKLKLIQENWVKKRLRDESYSPDTWFKDKWESTPILYNWLRVATKLDYNSKIGTDSVLNGYSNVIFEGAQGLLLDKHHKFFPFVTNSNTGLDNVKEILEGITSPKIFKQSDNWISVTYVTRPYMTRHGAGPLPTESDKLFFEDSTNKPNKFQGKIRFGYLDLDLMKEAIYTDISKFLNIPFNSVKKEINSSNTCGYRFNLAITCCNQISDVKEMLLKYNNTLHNIPLNKYYEKIESFLNIPIKYYADGRTADEVKYVKETQAVSS